MFKPDTFFMMQPVIFYCFDAYCSWCFGFTTVLKSLNEALGKDILFEVLPGGMILPKTPKHISTIAEFLLKTSVDVTNATGVSFGEDYLWHIRNPDESDWYPSSEKPSIALTVFKEYHPEKQIDFAIDMQYALFVEGRDLCDDEAYRHLLFKYKIPPQGFFERMRNVKFKEKVFSDFETVKKLHVSGYPCLLLQESEARLYVVSNGYADYDSIMLNINTVLNQIKSNNN